MSDVNVGMEYKIEFSGDAIECFIVPVSMEKAEEWLSRGGQALLRHAFGTDNEVMDEGDIAYIGRASDIAGAEHLEGCELRHGSVEITDAEGVSVMDLSLESEEFQDLIDDNREIDLDTHTLNGGPTLIVRSSYSGSVFYTTPPHSEAFDEAGWHVIISDLGGEPFISEVNFEGETLDPEGTGKFGLQEVWLNVPGENGELRQIYHSAQSSDS